MNIWTGLYCQPNPGIDAFGRWHRHLLILAKTEVGAGKK